MTKRTIRAVAVLAAFMFLRKVQAQVSWPQNNPNAPGTDYVGWDNGTTVPLMIKHEANQPIQWYTNNVQRMVLTPTLVNQSWPWYPSGLNFSGHLGIGSPVPSPPLTYLHVNSTTPGGFTVGYRPWMRVGGLFTQGSDGLYVGMRRLATGQTQGVVNWSDDVSDALSFVFTRAPDNASVSSSPYGLEIARMVSAPNGNEGFMGLGDFFSAGQQASERLDVLNRTIRIRRLLPDYQNNALDAVVVADANGRLHWRDASTFMADDCEWTLLGPPGSNSNVGTAFPGNPGCPQEDRGVGIGTPTPKFKLHVSHDYAESNYFGGSILSEYFAVNTPGISIQGAATPPIGTEVVNPNPLIGVSGLAADSRMYTVGVEGRAVRSAWGSPNLGYLNGVRGISEGNGNAGFSAGVYGIGTGSTNANNSWGGYFEGRGFLGASAWSYSDAQLKSGIEDLAPDAALDAVMQLSAKRYSFAHEQFPFLALPEGGHIGLLSQEVEAVLPELVMDVTRPAKVDSTGAEVEPEIVFKAMNYDGLIPVLVAAVQQQQGTIAMLQEEVEVMKGALATCCTADAKATDANDLLNGDGTPAMDPALDRLLTIAPNPFTDHTTVHYTVERPGRAQLLVNSADGRHIEVLHEGVMPAGAHCYEWSTAHLAPGVHYVTLLLDGEHVVKRAVKVR